jgi:hypothetical protein
MPNAAALKEKASFAFDINLCTYIRESDYLTHK